MLRIARDVLVTILSTIVIVIASPLLFWLGRSVVQVRSEMVVDEEVLDHELADLLVDDPGVDVDGDPA